MISAGGVAYWEAQGERGYSGSVPGIALSAFFAGRLTRVCRKRARLAEAHWGATGVVPRVADWACRHCTGTLLVVGGECLHCRRAQAAGEVA